MSHHPKRIALLGSTGSIGRNSLSVIESLGDGYIPVSAGAHRRWQALAQQARDYHLEKVVLTDTTHLSDLKKALSGTQTTVLGGPLKRVAEPNP